MPQNNTVSLIFKVAGDNGGFRKLTADADMLRKLIGETVKESESLKSSVFNFAAVTTSIDAAVRSIGVLKDLCGELSDAYSAQIGVETKLEVNMRNTMDARQQDIQSIKDLCSAQQKIGIIGDEVQLAGAQEMATYLSEKESLEKLIPVMNDMLAQQYDFNATQENAAQIGTMLGKVMDGQTGALKRYGYSFDEAQEEILKYGTESERAAVLCDVVSASIGGMNAELAKTDVGKQKQLENTLGDLKEQMGGLTQRFMPLLTSISTFTKATGGIIETGMAMKSIVKSSIAATKSLKAFWVSTATITSSTRGFTKTIATARLFVTQFGQAVIQGAKGLRLFATAWKGVLVSTGVGVAIAAVTSVIAYLTFKTNEASEAVEKLDAASEEYVRAGADAKTQIEGDAKALGELIKTGQDCTEMVKTLNERYGELFGTHQKESEWMDILTRKSQIYVKAKAYEAQVIALRQKAAEQAMKKEVAAEKMARLEKEGKDKTTTSRPVVTGRTVRARAVTVETEEYSKLKKEREEAEKLEKSITSELEVVEKKSADVQNELKENAQLPKASAMSYNQLTEAIDGNKKARQELNGTEPDYKERLKNLLTEKHELEARKAVLEKNLELETKHASVSGSGKPGKQRAIVADPTTKKQLQDNISLTREKLTGKDTEEEHRMLRNIRLWEEQLDVIKMTEAAYSRPASLDTLERIDEELQYQRTLRQKSNSEFIGGIDGEIKRLEDLRQSMEDAAFVPVPVEELKTYEQLERQLGHYRELIRRTSGEEREAAQRMVNSLEEVGKAWDTVLADLKKPADISLLDTSEKIDEALSYYRARQSRASADEKAEIQETINVLTKKNEVLNRGVDLVNLRRDVDEIEKLTGKDYKIRVKAMDVDTLTGQIRDLQRLLADTENPVTDEQRESIEALIGVYSKWRKEAYDTAGAVSAAWGEVKNLKEAVSSITSALDEDASAWERITGLVDGFVQAFQGLRSVIELISQLTTVTQGFTVAKEAETMAEQGDTVATAANTDVTAANTAEAEANTAEAEANTAVTASNTAEAEANTAAKSGEAVAEATASGAAIPFPGNLAAIAASVAAVMASLTMVGKFATGGIVGGSSPSGDRLLARVNSGEMILNMTQQKRLFNFLNGSGSIRGVSAPQLTRVTPQPADMTGRFRDPSGGINGSTVRFVIDGRTLVGVIANETRISSKSGKKTHIKL